MMETVAQPTLHSRKEIATWLKLQPYSQNLNDGVLFCRILQKSYPAYFLRLHEQPRTDSDCLSNFKMLGRCLDKNGLYKITDLDRFATGRDFFEFANWLKNFVEKNQSQSSGSAIQLLQQNREPARSPIPVRVKTAASVGNSSSKKDESDIAASSKDFRGFLQESSDSYLRREDSHKKYCDSNSFLKVVSSSQVMPPSTAPHFPPQPKKIISEVAPPPVSPSIDLYEVHQHDIKALLQLYAFETDVQFLRETLVQLRQTVESGQSIQEIKTEISNRLFERPLR